MEQTGGVRRRTRQSIIDKLPTVEIMNDITMCSICQEMIPLGLRAIKLPCPDTPHYFCLGDEPDRCPGIIPWLKENNTCPICRHELPYDEINNFNENQDNETEEPAVSSEHEEVNRVYEDSNEVPREELLESYEEQLIDPEDIAIQDMYRPMHPYVDEEGFDIRDFEEAIQMSLDDSYPEEQQTKLEPEVEPEPKPELIRTLSQDAAQGDIEAMRQMRLKKINL